MSSHLNKLLASMKTAYKAGYQDALPKWRDPKKEPPEEGKLVFAWCENDGVRFLAWLKWESKKHETNFGVLEYITIPMPSNQPPVTVDM